jgi:tRNA1(Val) A37 N6-methylase TrmN6
MELTCDAMGRGFLNLWQPARGYRFNTDSVLLGALAARHAAPGLMVDAGAGCGVAGLWAAKATGHPTLLLEWQKEMAQLAGRNAQHNAVPHAWAVHGDFRRLPVADGSVQTWMCNPPFHPPQTGRASPRSQRQNSMVAEHGGLADALNDAARALSPTGVAVVVGPPLLVAAMAPVGLHRTRTLVLGAEGKPPARMLTVFSRVMVPCVNEARTLQNADGQWSPWAAEILEGRVHVLV